MFPSKIWEKVRTTHGKYMNTLQITVKRPLYHLLRKEGKEGTVPGSRACIFSFHTRVHFTWVRTQSSGFCVHLREFMGNLHTHAQASMSLSAANASGWCPTICSSVDRRVWGESLSPNPCLTETVTVTSFGNRADCNAGCSCEREMGLTTGRRPCDLGHSDRGWGCVSKQRNQGQLATTESRERPGPIPSCSPRRNQAWRHLGFWERGFPRLTWEFCRPNKLLQCGGLPPPPICPHCCVLSSWREATGRKGLPAAAPSLGVRGIHPYPPGYLLSPTLPGGPKANVCPPTWPGAEFEGLCKEEA